MSRFASLVKQLHRNGLTISLDNFGTGQAGLSYINSLYFDKIKIDKHFIDAINKDSVDHHILTTIIDLASKLDVALVAEGVETEMQKTWLIEHGVLLGQRWLFSKYLTQQEFSKVVGIRPSSISVK